MQVNIIETTWQEDDTQLSGACVQQTTHWSHGEESHNGPNTIYSLVAMDVK